MAIARFLFCTLAFSLLAEGRAGKGCGKSGDGLSRTTSLEHSSSVLKVLIRASLTIRPKDSSSLNSRFVGRSRLLFPLSHASMLIVL